MGGAEQAGAAVLGRDTAADPCHGGRAVGQCPSFVCVPEARVGFAGSGWGRLPHLSPPRPSRRQPQSSPAPAPMLADTNVISSSTAQVSPRAPSVL